MRNMLFILFFTFVAQSVTLAQISIQYEQQDCCVSMKVNLPPGHNFRIDMDDGTFLFGNNENNEFEHCFTEKGDYFVKAIVLDSNGNPSSNGAGFIITITEEDIKNCQNDCPWYLCWEEYIGYFNCATSVTIELPDGTQLTLNFPVDPNPMPGGFNDVAIPLYQTLTSAGYDFEFSDSHEGVDCQKSGIGETSGFFITSDEFRIVSINGNDCNSGMEIQGNEFGNDCN